MTFFDFMASVARTWGHILVGLAVLFSVFLGCWMIGRWYNGLLNQIDELRRCGKLPPKPWKYQ